MMMRPAESIWIVIAGAQPGEGCEHPDNTVGATLQAFVPAGDVDEALALSRQAFTDHHFDEIDVDQVLRFDPEDWDDDSDPGAELRSLAKRSEDSQEIVCSVEWWGSSDPEANR